MQKFSMLIEPTDAEEVPNEVEFTASAASWMNLIIAKDRTSPFSETKCERRSKGAQKRRDLTLGLCIRFDRKRPAFRLIGCARVSTYGQPLDAQLGQLKAAGGPQIFREKKRAKGFYDAWVMDQVTL